MEVFIVARTCVTAGLDDYLASIGNPNWGNDYTVNHADLLTEAAGRICYRSWEPWNPDKPRATNRNVDRVRTNTKEYIKNLIDHGHTSTFEHASVTFIFKDVSRVCTHELVRHRAGCAYSQESQRYVQIELINIDPITREKFPDACEKIEAIYKELGVTGISKLSKEETSELRRLLPQGILTDIMMTANLRAWRHIIKMRTSPAAEREIKELMNKVLVKLKGIAPLCFQDM